MAGSAIFRGPGRCKLCRELGTCSSRLSLSLDCVGGEGDMKQIQSVAPCQAMSNVKFRNSRLSGRRGAIG